MSEAAQSADRTMASALLDAWPYARFLGVRLEPGEAGPTAVLPFDPKLIGNPILPALHGGVVASFLELAALARLDHEGRRARTIDITVDYLRPARPVTFYAEARILKLGRRAANLAVEAWQEDRNSPVAALRGHFMILG
ncbi:MAG TPA: PaaI family thioesterase [Caulobacteraceae bacterium]|nr:PaaI family thioesterase [Caulobacteraceae bacterium]